MFPLAAVYVAIKNGRAAASVDTSSVDSSIRRPIESWGTDQQKDAATILKAGLSKNRNWKSIHDKLFLPTDASYKTSFFDNTKVQRKLIKGIIEGTLDDAKITDALKSCTPNLDDKNQIVQKQLDAIVALLYRQPSMSFIFRFFHDVDVEAQIKIADALLRGEFGANAQVLQEIIANLEIFTDPAAKLKVAQAIRKGRFGDDPAVLEALVKRFGCFGNADGVYAKDVQEELAYAIGEGKFGINRRGKASVNTAVLIAIAGRFDIFTHPAAQRTVAKAINAPAIANIFGSDVRVLTAVAKKLNCFTTTEARSEIAVALLDDAFGTNEEVLKEVASHLGMFAVVINPNNFVNSDGAITVEMHNSLAQSVVADLSMQLSTLIRIADAIYKEKFGTHVIVQSEVTKHFDTFKPLDGDAEAIVFAKFDAAATTSASFGDAVAHLRKIPEAKKINDELKTLIPTQIEVFAKIARAFSENKFNKNSAVQRNIADNLALFAPQIGLSAEQRKTQDDAQKKLVRFIAGDYFNDPQAKSDAQIFLAHYIAEGKLSAAVMADDLIVNAAVMSFCANESIAFDAVMSLKEALAGGKFDGISAESKTRLQNHLMPFLLPATAIASATDPETQKALVLRLSKEPTNLNLPQVQEFVAKTLNEVLFDNTAAESEALGVLASHFGSMENISDSIANHLQKALKDGKFNAIDNALKTQLQAKVQENFNARPFSAFFQRNIKGALFTGTALAAFAVGGYLFYSQYQREEG